MTLRSLLAIKARLWWRVMPPAARTQMLVVLGLMITLGAPGWIGTAALAFAGVATFGAPALVVTFAAAQCVWMLVVLFGGAWVEGFDQRRMLRYPIHPRTVYLAGIVTGLVGLPLLAVMPGLGGAIAGAAARGGATAGVAAAFGAALLLALNGALVRLGATVLDRALQSRALRLITEAAGLLLSAGWVLAFFSSRTWLAEVVARLGRDPRATIERAASIIGRVMPTAAWPAAPGAGALTGDGPRMLAGGAAAVALGFLLIELGWRLAHRVALGRETAATRSPQRRDATRGARGASLLARLTARIPPLVERELRLAARDPRWLAMTLYPISVVLAMRIILGDGAPHLAPVLAIMLALPIQMLTFDIFGFEREGLRLLFLLPFTGRALVMAKGIAALAQCALVLALGSVALALTRFPMFARPGLELLAWATAAFLAALLSGQHLSVTHPVRLDARGRAEQGQGALAGLLHGAAILGAFAALTLLYWTARAVAPPAAREAAGVAMVWVAAAALVATWWFSLDRMGRGLDAAREHMLAAITVPTETG